MTKTTVLIILMIISSLTYAQKIRYENLPTVVKVTFKKKYPQVKKVKWNLEKENYKAHYSVARKNNSILIDGEGKN